MCVKLLALIPSNLEARNGRAPASYRKCLHPAEDCIKSLEERFSTSLYCHLSRDQCHSELPESVFQTMMSGVCAQNKLFSYLKIVIFYFTLTEKNRYYVNYFRKALGKLNYVQPC